MKKEKGQGLPSELFLFPLYYNRRRTVIISLFTFALNNHLNTGVHLTYIRLR